MTSCSTSDSTMANAASPTEATTSENIWAHKMTACCSDTLVLSAAERSVHFVTF